MDLHQVLIYLVALFGLMWFANVARLGRGRSIMYASTEGPVLAITLRLLFAATIGVTIALCVDAHALEWATITLPSAMRIAGALIALCGEMLFGWVVITLGRNYSTSLVIQKDHTLVVRGPYRYVRHPMYSSFTLYFAGISLLSANAIVAILATASLVSAMYVRTPIEEAMMLEKFGDEYRAYMQRTNRYVPRS